MTSTPAGTAPIQPHPAATPLVIAATSGAAAELVGIVRSPREGQTHHAVVAIVGAGELLAELARRLDVPLAASFAELDPTTVPVGAQVAITAGDHGAHRDLLAAAQDRGLIPATLIHRDTTIGPWVRIGTGSVLAPGVRVTGNVDIGAHCQLHTGAIVSHDDVLGEFVTLSPASTLCGGVTVGARSTVFAGATVMPGVTIGTDVVVGAGALVNRDVADGTTVVGVPARPLPAAP